MSTALTTSTAARPDGAVVLVVVGEIDQSNVGQFRDALAGALTGARVTVDLNGVTYLDSAGIAVLADHAARLRIATPPLLLPVIEISGLAELATVEVT